MDAPAQLSAHRFSFLVHSGDHAIESANPYVLIATRDDRLRGVVKDALGQLRYSGRFVRSGGDAVTAAHSHPSSLVLLDQSLPDLAGLEVARALSHDTPERRFVLIGSRLTTSITVEAMKLGALTVLEKPVGLNEIVSLIRSAAGDNGTAIRGTARATAPPRGAPRSIGERWALHVLKACESDGDLKTLGAWASFVGLSHTSLCESCRLVAIQPLDARDLTRVLRAVVQSRRNDCRPEELLDVSDRRTLRTLMIRAGLGVDGHGRRISVEQFLASQRFVPSTNAGLAVLRALVLH